MDVSVELRTLFAGCLAKLAGLDTRWRDVMGEEVKSNVTGVGCDT